MSSVTSALPNSGMPQAASTVAPNSLAVCTPAEKRIAIRGLSWELYDALSDAIDQKQRVFLAYDGTDLEIMVKGREHDHYKDLVGQLVHVIADDLRTPHRGAGETTWKRIELLRGVEADQCYFFATEKLARDTAALKRRSQNIDDYPNPDLAIEIDMSPPQIDRHAIYAALRVPELWRFDGESVVIAQLGSDGTYSPTVTSDRP
jgi:Uma2 family endonuclease